MLLIARVPGESSPGGDSTSAGAYVGGDLHSLMVSPTDPAEVFIGGHQSAAVSRDGGRTFRQISGLARVDAMSWAIGPDGKTQVVGGHNGLRTSIDGGEQWTVVSSLPGNDIHAIGLDPSAPRHLVAYVVGQGIFTSSDLGATWQMNGGANLSLMGPLLVSPGGRDLIAADMMQGIVASHDGGANWSALSSGVRASWLARDPAEPRHLLRAGDGLAESTDGGASWQPLSSSPNNMSAVAIGSGASPTWYAAALVGDHAVVFTSLDRGAHWQQATPAR